MKFMWTEEISVLFEHLVNFKLILGYFHKKIQKILK